MRISWDQGPIPRLARNWSNRRVMPAPALLVAIVDDEESVRKALERLLRAAGLCTETFASGRAFLDSLATRRPDCLILDLHMPGMGGVRVLQHLQCSSAPLPTVVITAFEAPETRAFCLSAGAWAYLRKPLDDRALLDAIAKAVPSELDRS